MKIVPGTNTQYCKAYLVINCHKIKATFCCIIRYAQNGLALQIFTIK